MLARTYELPMIGGLMHGKTAKVPRAVLDSEEPIMVAVTEGAECPLMEGDQLVAGTAKVDRYFLRGKSLGWPSGIEWIYWFYCHESWLQKQIDDLEFVDLDRCHVERRQNQVIPRGAIRFFKDGQYRPSVN